MITGRVGFQLENRDTGEIRNVTPISNTIGRNGKEQILGKIVGDNGNKTTGVYDVDMDQPTSELKIYSDNGWTTNVATLTGTVLNGVNTAPSVVDTVITFNFEDDTTATYTVGSLGLRRTTWTALTAGNIATESFAYVDNANVVKADNEILKVTWDITVGAVAGLTLGARKAMAAGVVGAPPHTFVNPYLVMWTNLNDLASDTADGDGNQQTNNIWIDVNSNDYLIGTTTWSYPSASTVEANFNWVFGDGVWQTEGTSHTIEHNGIVNSTSNAAGPVNKTLYIEGSGHGTTGTNWSSSKLDNRQWTWDLAIGF